jgi:hypothetical protein
LKSSSISPSISPKFKTFAIRDARLNSKSPSLNSELVKKRINADIVKFLEAKGLEFVVEGASQLNVRYTLEPFAGLARHRTG